MLIESFIFFIFIVDMSHKILYNITIDNARKKEKYMSYQIQDAITEYVDEQIESKIGDAIDENSSIQDIRNDVDTLTSRLDEEVVNDVVKNVITKLMESLDGNYVMVRKSYLDSLTKKDVA